MEFFILARFVHVKCSRAFVVRPLQGTSSLASRLTTVSLDNMNSYQSLLFSSKCTEYVKPSCHIIQNLNE